MRPLTDGGDNFISYCLIITVEDRNALNLKFLLCHDGTMATGVVRKPNALNPEKAFGRQHSGTVDHVYDDVAACKSCSPFKAGEGDLLPLLICTSLKNSLKLRRKVSPRDRSMIICLPQ